MAENIFSDGKVNRLMAGNSDNGGLQNVNNDHPSNKFNNVGFRLIDAGVSFTKISFETTCHFAHFFKTRTVLQVMVG